MGIIRKTRDRIRKAAIRRAVKRLSKTAVVFRDDYQFRCVEAGPKTYGRLSPIEAVATSIAFVHGPDYERRLQVSSLSLSEDGEAITVTVGLFRPGVLIGKMGSKVEQLENVLTEVFGKKTVVRIVETKRLYGLDVVEIL